MRLLLVLSCALAGCYDFDALGPPGADLSVAVDDGTGGSGSDDDGGVADGGALACSSFDQCPRGENCVDGHCQGAVTSCAATKSAWPKSRDGLYWLAATDGAHLAYCDMALGRELCTDTMAMHSGKTREGSSLDYTMVSQLSADGGICELWAARASDGYPLGRFDKDVAGITLNQCQALGFVDDSALGQCAYGTDSGYSNCGFAVTPLYVYGHKCTGCMLNSGTFTHYVKMGPFTSGATLTTVDGVTRARCKTR
jgi:hypothetical protein